MKLSQIYMIFCRFNMKTTLQIVYLWALVFFIYNKVGVLIRDSYEKHHWETEKDKEVMASKL